MFARAVALPVQRRIASDRQAWLARLGDPGYCPGARDVPALLELAAQAEAIGDRREIERRVVEVLARGDRGVAQGLARELAAALPDERALRVRALAGIGRRLAVPELAEILTRALADEHPRVVRQAARAIGKASDDDAIAQWQAPLLAALERAALPERRAIVDALARLGGAEALARLAAMTTEDEDLARRIADAIALIRRRSGRAQGGRIDPLRVLPQPVRVVLRCRGGLADIVAAQARDLVPQARPSVVRPDEVELRTVESLHALSAVRSAIDVALAFDLAPGRALAERIAALLRAAHVVEALQAWTDGPVRFRLAFAAGGHRRATIREVVRGLEGSPLVNDSRDVAWTIEVDEARGRVLASPALADPRFSWRRADVPAASHPTIAAALAWVAAPRPAEVVWDPFCGSGAELVECARLRPGLHLVGTDHDPRALAACETNVAAAALEVGSVDLRRADALTDRPTRPPTLVVCNPPMGGRIAIDGGPRRLLVDFVRHVADVLAPGGRVVWLSPIAADTAGAARRAGLRAEDRGTIDLAGFSAALQVLRKRG